MWICHDCGTYYGSWRGHPGDVETWHMGTCEWCEEIKPVCHCRRYGWPKKDKE